MGQNRCYSYNCISSCVCTEKSYRNDTRANWRRSCLVHCTRCSVGSCGCWWVRRSQCPGHSRSELSLEEYSLKLNVHSLIVSTRVHIQTHDTLTNTHHAHGDAHTHTHTNTRHLTCTHSQTHIMHTVMHTLTNTHHAHGEAHMHAHTQTHDT